MKKIKNLIHSCAKFFAHFCTLTFSAGNVMGKGIRSAFRPIVGMASSYGASDEHPMSIRSASDGITRRTRLVPHIAAVFFMLFFVGVGNVWGATTANCTVKVICQDNPAPKDGTFGKVAVKYSSSLNPVPDAPAEDDNGDNGWNTSEAKASRSQTTAISGKYFVMYAEGINGYIFEGWYTNESCTTPATTTAGAANQNSASPFAYKFSVTKNNSGSFTFFAKFVKAGASTKINYEISSYNAAFAKDDYDIYAGGIIYPTTEVNTQKSLDEDESIDLIFRITALSKTRGVRFVRWYYKAGTSGTKVLLTSEKEYTLTYDKLKQLTDANPGKTIIFGVDVEKKATHTVTFKTGGKGPYQVRHYDANSSWANSCDNFQVGKDADISDKTFYESDGVKLEYTTGTNDKTSNEYNTTSGYIFHSWYCKHEDDDTKYQLTDGVANVIDTILPDDVVEIGATFVEADTKNITFLANEHGSYKVNAVTYNSSKGKSEFTVSESNRVVNNLLINSAITLSNPVSNDPSTYSFYRWYYVNKDGVKKTLANLEATATVVLPSEAVSVGMEFSQAGDYAVSGLYFNSLSDAIQAAQTELKTGAKSSTILVARDATVPAGNYTIPQNVTLLIPYKDGQTKSSGLQVIVDGSTPTEAYHTLTLANGAHLEVYGTIEVSGCQTTGGGDGKGDTIPSRTGGTHYGMMDMKGGSSITLNGGSHLYAWGYVIGDRGADGRYTCEIDVRRGATVHEHFQIGDWKGAFPTMEICKKEGTYAVLPICQYFIQNVEVPARYRPGSRLLGAASLNIDIFDKGGEGITFAMSDAGLVGVKYVDQASDHAVFLLDDTDESEDTWVRKFYDPATDQQVYEINNSADVGSLVMKVSIPGIGNVTGGTDDELNIDSRYYQFPITNNFKMHLLSGEMHITQMTEMLPGSVIEIDKKSTMTINAKYNPDPKNEITPTLLFYDADDWGKYIFKGNINGVQEFTYGTRIKGRPGGVPMVRDISTKTSQGDAKLIVHGSVDVKGMLLTTNHGASITSTIEDAGTISFATDAPASVSKSTWQVSGITGSSMNRSVTYTSIPRKPALLKNGTGSTYGETSSTASTEAGQSFCFFDMNGDGKGEWVRLTDDGCFAKDTNGIYYAKPKEYVALANGKTANADHTYSDAAGAGRLFIHMDDCQWWEVENVDNLYHCLHPDNNTYYYWNENRGVGDTVIPGWEEKKFEISWKNWDGSNVKDADGDVIYPYELTYGVTPKFNGMNPTRPDDVDYTYNFIGWSPALAPVTGDVTYTAVYEKIQKKYVIIYKDADGNEIARQQLALGETPTPPVIGVTSYWEPAIGVVTGNTTYTLRLGTPETYTVTFVNYDGSEYSTKSDYALEDEIVIPEDPERAATSEYEYRFTGWSPAIESGAKVTGNATYTAQYEATDRTYAIRFYKEDGETQIGETQYLPQGADPVAPAYTKASDAEYTYATEWKIKDSGRLVGVSVPSVSGAADYKASFAQTRNRYTVKLQSNNNSVCTFAGAGVFDYGTTELAVSATIGTGYEFSRWDGDADVVWEPVNEETPNIRRGTIATLTHDITLTLYVVPDAGTSDKIVGNGETLDIMSLGDSDRECKDFVLNSNGVTSSQVSNIDKLTIWGDAYYDLAISSPTDRTWYSVAVPWAVDATTGIYAKNGSSSRRLVLGSDFDIIYYNGDCRAAGGTQCWDYLEDQSDKTMHPGKAYMIAFRSTPQTIRFQRANRTPLLNTEVTVEAHPSGDGSKANWNGIANPALYYAYLNVGAASNIGHVYVAGRMNHETGERADGYTDFNMSANQLIVGQPVYVQTPDAKTVVVNSSSYASAPRRRMPSVTDTRYTVEIAQNGYQYDRIYLQTDDEKEDRYVIGQDLAKMGVSSKIAQMWVDRYGSKLCVNTTASENEVVTYPLGLFAPIAGEYTIYIASQPDDDNDLYVTLDGTPVWNLSNGAYTVSLEKGTTTRYGLRISAKTPQVTTGTEEVDAEKNDAVQKILIDNQIYIIRENRVYTVDGQLVK